MFTMIEKSISDSAFLVNESRARSEHLSLDIYAKLWVDDPVRELWCRFNREVYSKDPRALAVRNRFFLKRLEIFFKTHPQAVFLNIAAGFTSYPYLMNQEVEVVEVDLPRVVEYKKDKVKEFISAGNLPGRKITYIAADLNCLEQRNALFSQLHRTLNGRPSFILFEGITYYLDRDAFFSCMEQAAGIQTRGSELSMDYWEPGVEKNQVFIKFCDFLDKRCGHPSRSYNLLTSGELASIDGYKIDVKTDVSAFERQITDKTELQDWEARLPENFVVLVKT